ncbi:MAG: DCC1-like thiol-disulfide oxidoreductase family protein [Planctomycetota bacterium]
MAPVNGSFWQRFWYAPVPLTRLAAFRIIIMILALWDLVGYSRLVLPEAAAVSGAGTPRPWNPIFAFEVLGLQPIGLPVATAVYTVLLVAIACGILGIATRVACLVVALLAFYWSGLAYSFGKPHHDKIALVFALLALPLAPVGARLSIDSLIARVRRVRRGGAPTDVPRQSEWAGIPMRLCQLTIALGYFLAGASKLKLGGLEWLNGYTLQGIMMGHDNHWSAFFAGNRRACQVMSAGLVFTQFTYPVVLLWPRLLWFYIPSVTLMHLITWHTMDTGPYMSLWLTQVAFLPLDRAPAAVRTWLTTGPLLRRLVAFLGTAAVIALVLYVLFMNIPTWVAWFLVWPAAAAVLWLWPGGKVVGVFDGGCGFCRRALAVLHGLDWCGKVAVQNLVQWDEVAQRFPQLDAEACTRDLHVVDARGRVSVGFGAYQVLAWRLPLVLPLAPLLYLPPVTTIGRKIYRGIADGRRRDLGHGVCRIGPSG